MADATEVAIWDWATGLHGLIMWGHEWQDRETCTTCRAVYAENCISRWRTSVQPQDIFSRQVAAVRCGIFANLLGASFEPMSMFGLARQFLRSNGAATVDLMTVGEWSHKKRTTTVRPLKTEAFWYLRTTSFLQPMVPDFQFDDLLLGHDQGFFFMPSQVSFWQESGTLLWQPKQWQENPESKKKRFEFSAEELLPMESWDSSSYLAIGYVPCVISALAGVDVISLRTKEDDWSQYFESCFVAQPGTGKAIYTPKS